MLPVLLFFSYVHAGDTVVVKLGSTCTTDHLQEVCEREVDVPLLSGVVKLCALDDDQAGGEVDSPGQSRRGD
mgnify:CR=1 FL=1